MEFFLYLMDVSTISNASSMYDSEEGDYVL